MEAYALTDIGRVRTMNQDYIYSSPEKVGSLPNLFLVADGMGGHRAGDYASRFAVENLVIYINRAGDGSPVMQLKRGIEAVNGMLYEESLKREELKGMGCTLVAGVVEEIEPEKNRVSVMVSMFGRETPVELELDQVEVQD